MQLPTFHSAHLSTLLPLILSTLTIVLSTPITSCAPPPIATLAPSAITSGEVVGVIVICSTTYYLQEPNFYPAITWPPADAIPSISHGSSVSLGSCAPPNVATLAPSAISAGEVVGVVVICETTYYLQEPNFYPAITWPPSSPTFGRAGGV